MCKFYKYIIRIYIVNKKTNIREKKSCLKMLISKQLWAYISVTAC